MCFIVGPIIDASHFHDQNIQSGNIATITCSLTEGDPPVEFKWTKDDKPVESLPEIQIVSQKFSSLLTISSTSSIHAGNYFCKASNPVSWSLRKARVFVDGISLCS